MIRRTLAILALLLLPLMTVAPAPAGALFDDAKQQACNGANLTNDGANCNDKSKGEDKIQSTLQSIINILTAIVGIAAVVLIIVSGLRFITANGDSGSINQARNGIIYAVVGLIIVSLAQAIVRFVLSRI